MGVYGLAGHAFRLQDGKEGHYMTLASSTRNCAAVTGACLLTTREAFEAEGGFDEVEFPVNLQDVDYCLKVQASGRRVVYAPEATLLHYETSTRKDFGASSREMQVMRERWGAWIENDPYYNPNLTRTKEDFSLRFD
jgi:GT2 family glycosyltransferase